MLRFRLDNVICSIIVASVFTHWCLKVGTSGLLEIVATIVVWSAEIIYLKKVIWKNGRINKIKGKAVLITGCDRGFGARFAKKLNAAGFQVFAGCKDKVGNREVRQSLHYIQLDVTKDADVEMALKYIREKLNGNVLWGVVNNAGISKGSDIAVTPMSKIQEVLDVNLLGVIRVTKAFLPLLKESKGRIVNVASAAGRLILPGFLPYSTSKSAVISFSDGLRLELRKHGIQVITIEPWTYRTAISDVTRISNEIQSGWTRTVDHRRDLRRAQKNAQLLFTSCVSDNIDEVADVVEAALTLSRAPYRYSPGKWYLNWMMVLLHFVPKPIADFVFCRFVFRR